MILRGHSDSPIRIETDTEKGACASAIIGLWAPAFRAQYQMPVYCKYLLK
ncbi:hypothetical protein DSCO28_60000 [Desulfosarcina ovata subsp. sediminis]|uniref:Uncharacterized protein n=1 Tax=Desulfosarcina ovata subsp. sediminis TaxID=885957 RepID=A0A5K7ZZ52_9BACT|nr:hypothetical protein DSCO28_60000 [Desulfosarcina ovata subsp. sediminis]